MSLPTDDPGRDQIGVRELRRQLAAALARARAGEELVITIDSRPVARLGPLAGEGRPDLDDLVATGQVLPPDRHDRPAPFDPEPLPVDVRWGDALDDVRGR